MNARLAIVLALAGGGPLVAQNPIRAGVVGSARVGQKAPEVVLPYFTEAGQGPADQPFRLSAELGRRVVLVFGPADQPIWWQAVATGRAGWGAVVLAGVVVAAPQAVAEFAAKLAAPELKLLPDERRAIGRRFGVSRSDRTIVVVGETGLISYVRRDFDPTDPHQTAEVGTVLSARRP